MFARKPRSGAVIHVLSIAVMVFNALGPTAASALTLSEDTTSEAATIEGSAGESGRGQVVSRWQEHAGRAKPPFVLQDGTPVTPVETVTATPTPEPSLTPTLEAASTPASTLEAIPSATPTSSSLAATGQSPLSFKLSAAPGEASPGEEVTFTVEIANRGSAPVTGLLFSNTLPNEFGNAQSGLKEFKFDPQTRLLTWESASALPAGQTLILTYTVRMDGQQDEVEIVDSATLTADGLSAPLQAEAALTLATRQKDVTALEPQGGKALGLNGRVQVSLPPEAVKAASAVVIEDLSAPVPGEGLAPAAELPWMTFALELRVPQPEKAQSLPAQAGEQDRVVSMEPVEAQFDQPVELAISFDGLADLSTLEADKIPFLVTLDEASGTWVNVPLKSIEPETNRITADVTHFSTWGAGIGSAFPTNGAGVLLFDEAAPDLFTGRTHYSIPIWTPPGRNGMAPSLALSYSSGNADGILGDVQAPWTGMGWSVDSVEIARKIKNGICGTSCGGGSYGYENKFLLLFNGTGYELIPDGTTPGRYHTKSESFLYIQLHSNNLGNNTPAATNTTSEWWEVVEKNGTRWRLGWTTGSEQLAAMKGYPGAATGAWATLGYAGSATDVVTASWRADQVTDTHGNQMTFAYFEESRPVAGTATNYDRASYLDTIAYTGHTSGIPAPGYSVVFVRQSRGTTEVPAPATDWDNWGTFRLGRIDVKYGTTVVRSYDLSYQVRPYSDGGASWQTTVLDTVTISGGGTTAPSIRFTYVDKDNRAAQTASSNEWPYPRLEGITNGWGGSVTFAYGNDGRPYTSWYNWRATALDIDAGPTADAMQTTYAYGTPCYKVINPPDNWTCNATNSGELVGYDQTTATTKNFAGGSTLASEVHKFHTDLQKAGREYQLQQQDASGTVLVQTDTTYTVVTTGLPAGGYFTFASTVDQSVRGSSLSLVSRREYDYDTATGNLTAEREFDATLALYRWTEYQYSVNSLPSVWILDKIARRLLRNPSGAALIRWEYGYDGRLPQTSGTMPTVGDLTLKRLIDASTSTNTAIDTKYLYDAYGNVIETRLFKSYGDTNVQPSGTYISYLTGYDTALKTYVVSSDPPLLPATTTGYDFGLGVPTTVTDANGNTTTTAYDGLGRVTSITYPGFTQANVKYTYPTPPVSAPFAIKMEMWDEAASPAAYRTAWQIVDGLARVIQTQSPYETAGVLVVTDTSYNAQGLTLNSGLPRTVSAAGGSYLAQSWSSIPHTTTSYDALGRTASVDYPGTGTGQETYTYSGLRTTVLDRNNHQKVQENDAFGHLVKVEEYTGSSPYTLYATTTYQYDIRDLLTKVTDAAGNQTTMTYDRYGRKTAMSDPDMGTWSYGYSVLGNLTSQTDARSCVIATTYDDINRPTGKTYTGPGACNPTPDVTYTYDAIASGNEGWGRRTGMTDGSGSTAWSYNALGQVASETHTIDGSNFTITTDYDAFGRILDQVVPSQGSTEHLFYTYNAMGLPSSLANGSTNYVSQIHYDASGQVTDQVLGNNLVQQFCYDADTLRLIALRVYPGTLQACGTAPATPRLNLSYTYQPNGNVSQIVDATRSETLNFAYDELDRLDTVSGAYSQNYDYNAIGNITAKNTTSYTYANAAHKHAVTSLGTGESYTYDANGNMITRVEGGVTYTQTFDAENRLVSVTVSGQTTQFVYDGDGNLVKKINPDNTRTLYVGGIYESNRNAGGTTTSTKTFYPAGGAMREDGTRYYILKDHLGSANVVTNQSGTSVGENRFYSFGETRAATGSMHTDKLFTGQREITGLGIYHYGARFYSPKLGRFLSPDSIVPGYANPQSLNRFSYVNNNPLRYIDPSGHMFIEGAGFGGGSRGGSCNIFTSNCNPPKNTGGSCTSLACSVGSGSTNRNRSGGGCDTLACGGSNPFVGSVTVSGGGNVVSSNGSVDSSQEQGGGGHYYQTEHVVCLAEFKCTEDEMRIYATMFQYPGQNPLFRVQHNGLYFVAPAPQLAMVFGNLTLNQLGAIQTTISPDGLTLTNNSLPTHIFHKGIAVRSYTQREDGAWVVTTTGEGTNVWPLIGPGIDIANEQIGPPVFTVMDAQMLMYITSDQILDGTFPRWEIP